MPSVRRSFAVSLDATDANSDLQLLHDTQAYLRCQAEHRIPSPSLREAWERFYDRYTPVLRRYALKWRVPPADLHDCLQDVWKDLLRSLLRLDFDPRRARLESWLSRLVRSKATDLIRRRARNHAESLDRREVSFECPSSNPLACLERQADQEVVRGLLAELRQRVSPCSFDVLYMRSIEGRTVPEIAATLGLTTRQVWFRYHRMKRRLLKLCTSRRRRGAFACES